MCERLQADNDPALGLSGLPDDARRACYDIAYYFQLFVSLRQLDIVDDEVISTMRMRMTRVWQAMAPFVEREREITAEEGPKLFCILEDFATVPLPPPRSALHQDGTPRCRLGPR